MQGRRGCGNGGDLVVVEYSIPRSLTLQITPHRRCTRLMIEKRLMNFRQAGNGEAIYCRLPKANCLPIVGLVIFHFL
ncbi:MAG: hypothetical protein GYA35_05940 [Thermoanaerobaculaceae bacterium]|nr:hypothetical protein [Thermoanaerobaculaceae bacterium]